MSAKTRLAGNFLRRLCKSRRRGFFPLPAMRALPEPMIAFALAFFSDRFRTSLLPAFSITQELNFNLSLSRISGIAAAKAKPRSASCLES